MSDIADLKIKIDATDVSGANRQLDSLGRTSKRATRDIGDLESKTSRSFALMRTGVAALGSAFAAAAVFKGTITQASQFETALVGVSKTTGLVGRDLDNFANQITNISRSIPVTTTELLSLAQAAGQMGVSGSANLEKFSVTIAKLGRASDLSGEQAATALARILNVTGEAVSEVDTLASVIVSLGNNVAATESEIARMTNEVARSAGVFGVTSAEAAAMAAAMASIGIRAESGGSAVGRAMQTITSAVTEGGSGLENFANALDLNAEVLTDLFAENKTKAFEFFLQNVGELGLDAGNALKEVGLGGQEISKTLIPLASNMDIFTRTMGLANAEVANATALDREFEASLKTLDSTWQITLNTLSSFAVFVGDRLIPIIDSALKSFNDLAASRFFTEVGENIDVATFSIGRLIALVSTGAQQLQALLTFNFADIRPIGQDFIDQTKAGIKELVTLGDAEKNIAVEVENATPAIISNTNSLIGNGSALKTRVSEADKFLASLKKQNSQIGKTTSELLEMEAAELGVSKQAASLIEQNTRLNRQFNEESIAAQELNEELREVEQVTRSVMTAEEKFIETQTRLNQLLGSGLSAESYSRALKKAESDLIGLGSTSRSTFDDMDQYAISAARNIQSSFADFLFDPFEGGLKGMLKSFSNILKRMLAEMASSAILRSVFGGAGLGFSGSSFAGSVGGSFGLMDVASGSSSLFNAFSGGASSSLASAASFAGETFGISALSSFGAGASGAASAGAFGAGGSAFLGGSGTALGGTAATEFGAAATAGAGASALAAPLAGIGIGALAGGFIAGDKGFGGVATGQNAAIAGAVAGATIGSVVPVIGTAIGAVIGGIVGGLSAATFGRGPLKQKQTNLIGTVTSGGIEGATSTKFVAAGGFARSDKVDRVINSLDSGELLGQFRELSEGGISGKLDGFAGASGTAAQQIGNFLDANIQQISTSLRDVAGQLGLSSDAIDNFSTEINVAGEKGKGLVESDLLGVLADISTQMSTDLVASVEGLSRKGETAFETLQRIGTEFEVLSFAAATMGASIVDAGEQIRGISFDDRSAFIEAAGGIDAFARKSEFIFTNIIAESDRLRLKSEKLSAELAKVGVTSLVTVEQLKEAWMSGELSTDLKLAALNLAPLIVEVENLSAAASRSSETMGSMKVNENNIIELKGRLTQAYDNEVSAIEQVIFSLESSIDTIKSAKDSLLLGGLSPLTPTQKLDEARTQFNRTRSAAAGGDVDALNRLPEAATEFLKASRVVNASGAAFTSDFNIVTSVLEDAEITAINQLDTAEMQLLELKDSVSLLVDINAGVDTVASVIKDLTAAFAAQGLSPTGSPISDNVTQGITGAASGGGGSISDNVTRNSVSDAQIVDFFNANISNPLAIYNAAVLNGVSSERLSEVTGTPLSVINDFVQANNLAPFRVGSDFIPHDGIAMLHKGEAVTPSSVPAEIVALRKEVAEMRRAVVTAINTASDRNSSRVSESQSRVAKSEIWNSKLKRGFK